MISINNKNMVLLTNIQRFSLHDGPGIRTTIFLKGCSVCCPWCSNPENLIPKIQNYVKDGVSCTYGKYYTLDSLYQELIKDKPFYIGEITDYNITFSSDLDKLPGGVTFSGGEAMLQMENLEPLLKRLKLEHIHMALETCLFINPKQLKIAIRYIDLFYVDIKILDKIKCKEIIYGNLDVYLINLSTLFASGKPIVIRLPVIGGYTDDEKNRKEIIKLLTMYHPLKVELIKEHNLGCEKYYSLGMKPLELYTVTDEFMEIYKSEIEKTGVWAEICKI